jgi:DNA-binding transcriptional ArsR family regulator
LRGSRSLSARSSPRGSRGAPCHDGLLSPRAPARGIRGPSRSPSPAGPGGGKARRSQRTARTRRPRAGRERGESRSRSELEGDASGLECRLVLITQRHRPKVPFSTSLFGSVLSRFAPMGGSTYRISIATATASNARAEPEPRAGRLAVIVRWRAIGQLVQRAHVTSSSASLHVNKLQRAGLVGVQRVGRRSVVHLRVERRWRASDLPENVRPPELQSGLGCWFRIFVLSLELVRPQVAEARMRAHGVVVSAPCRDDDAGLFAIPEPLQVEALLAESAVEALVSAVLPGFAGSMCAVSMHSSPARR